MAVTLRYYGECVSFQAQLRKVVEGHPYCLQQNVTHGIYIYIRLVSKLVIFRYLNDLEQHINRRHALSLR